MILSKVGQDLRRHLSRGVCSGIMPTIVLLGATPSVGVFIITGLQKRFTLGRYDRRPFVLVEYMAQAFSKQFYSSAAWQSCRNEYMKCAHYLCEDCMKRGIYRPAKEVHHIEELTPENIYRPEVSLSFDNLVALCKECHKARHNQNNKGRRYMFGDNGEIILK